jgi:hypothetical protein
MRKLVMIGLLLLAGCQNVAGPFQPRPNLRVDDPRVSIEEQKYRARDQLALPDDFSGNMPRSGAALPSSGGQVGGNR